MTIPGFFSYARRDWRAEQAFIQGLVDILEVQARAAHGSDAFHLWRDETGLRWGNDWPNKLHEQIGKTELFFVLLSPSWMKSDICRDERHRLDHPDFDTTRCTAPARSQRR